MFYVQHLYNNIIYGHVLYTMLEGVDGGDGSAVAPYTLSLFMF